MDAGPPTGGGNWGTLPWIHSVGGGPGSLEVAPYKLYTFNVDAPYINHTTLSPSNVRQCTIAGSLLYVINAILKVIVHLYSTATLQSTSSTTLEHAVVMSLK